MKFTANQPIILASQSPRRRELLGMLGIDFIVTPSLKQEPAPQGFADAVTYVRECARIKAEDVAEGNADSLVIGSDTVVVLDGEVLLKPKNKEQAKHYLEKLSGRTHEVITAVALVNGKSKSFFHEVTEVTFYDLPESWIEAYTATEDPYDKAGAYGIQTVSGLFVQKIEGDYHTVVGLPIASLTQQLSKEGYISLAGSGVRC